MGVEELHILLKAETRLAIERNIERRHTDVALDKSLCSSALVAQQVKYLQRAKQKLPMMYESRCIIPPRAFEQCSSEVAAAHKSIEGDSVLELTCGLGVDAVALSKCFKMVVTIERDEVLAEVVRENLRRLKIDNIEVITSSAEVYLKSCTEHFDWVYVDPDRRGEDGKKRVVLQDCSPNILELLTDIERVSDNLAIKCSPLFDVDEAFRLFPNCRVEVVSLSDECKEVMIYRESGRTGQMIGATALGRGEVWMERETKCEVVYSAELEGFKYLLIPDVALQKSRLARSVLSECSMIWSDNGFGFMSEEGRERYNPERHLSRIFKIDWIGEYEPKRVRKILSDRGIKNAEIFKRDSPYSNAQIFKQLRLKEGGRDKIAVTKLQNRVIIAILSQ